MDIPNQHFPYRLNKPSRAHFPVPPPKHKFHAMKPSRHPGLYQVRLSHPTQLSIHGNQILNTLQEDSTHTFKKSTFNQIPSLEQKNFYVDESDYGTGFTPAVLQPRSKLPGIFSPKARMRFSPASKYPITPKPFNSPESKPSAQFDFTPPNNNYGNPRYPLNYKPDISSMVIQEQNELRQKIRSMEMIDRRRPARVDMFRGVNVSPGVRESTDLTDSDYEGLPPLLNPFRIRSSQVNAVPEHTFQRPHYDTPKDPESGDKFKQTAYFKFQEL